MGRPRDDDGDDNGDDGDDNGDLTVFFCICLARELC